MSALFFPAVTQKVNEYESERADPWIRTIHHSYAQQRPRAAKEGKEAKKGREAREALGQEAAASEFWFD